MTAQKIQSILDVEIDEVLVENRLRPVSDAGVEAIMASVNELGIIKDPIHVRKLPHRGNRLVLMAGGHRLEAARRLGWERIPATVWTCNDAWARLLEVDDNLASAELTPLDNAIFLAERILSDVLAGVGLVMSRSRIVTELCWLRENGFITFDDKADFIVVQGATSGIEIAQGISTHPEIQRPRPRARG